MLDFFKISMTEQKNGKILFSPSFKSIRSRDLMIRGRAFYAVWNEDEKIWCRDEYYIVTLIDKALSECAEEYEKQYGIKPSVAYMYDFSSKKMEEWNRYIKSMPDNYYDLDSNIIFSNDSSKKTNYSSRRLSYSLSEEEPRSYNELMDVIYDPLEREKIEWAIGSIFCGESKDIQKFLVFYGGPGTGKSTVLHIMEDLFEGYYVPFDAAELASRSNSFALDAFSNNPLVGIQHDGDLSRIETNNMINSIVSHEEMKVNEKFKKPYSMKFNTMLFMGTNKPVMITDAKSGLLRRLIDVHPSGEKVSREDYDILMNQIQFEKGAIVNRCMNVFKRLGKRYYDSYRPQSMMSETNDFYNYMEEMYLDFSSKEYVTLNYAWNEYLKYCEDSKLQYPLIKRRFKFELMNYFDNFRSRYNNDWNCYFGFKTDKFIYNKKEDKEVINKNGWINFNKTKSILDEVLKEEKAQYANEEGAPRRAWREVRTNLCDFDTSICHYVLLSNIHHIVIDFDIKDEKGEKSLDANIEAAKYWPPTYAELSKSGKGIHLHYIYDGDPEELNPIYGENIEIKVFKGNSSLRRKLTKCNDLPIATLSEGTLPKKEKKMLDWNGVKNENHLRNLIKKCLRKEHHGSTKPEVDFIFKILEDAYNSNNISYDLTDMRPGILAFANNSTNQSAFCVDLVSKMHFQSKDKEGDYYIPDIEIKSVEYEKMPIIFFDVEVFPNFNCICWKKQGEGNPCVRMINPDGKDVEDLFKYRLVGFNNRRYDNHILYAITQGYSKREVYEVSQRIVTGSKNAFFGQAWNLSYTDIYDFSSKKQSLKKWEIELGIHHQENAYPWDEELPEEVWNEVVDYCCNDVIATEAVWNARYDDFVAREILSDLSGLSVNTPNNTHSARIIFGDDPNPQTQFVYTDLSKEFPGYSFDNGKSFYKNEKINEGGYVYAEPGIYYGVVVPDVESEHPHSILALNLFGSKYTARFKDLLDIRIAIKHKDYDKVRNMFDGKLSKYLTSKERAKSLSAALKIVINSVYGLTAAHFDNKFRDPRNIDNIVAKRGSLFMIDLKRSLQKKGIQVVHCKTDSIKIPNNPSQEIIDYIFDFGKRYGYNFEIESVYEKMCLVNDAVYIAKENGEWKATGAQFAHPYVFKTLFSKEPIEFKDMCETKSVNTKLYLDFNEEMSEDEHDYHFVGTVGSFVPVREGNGGGTLLREKDGKYYAVTGTKGYRWLEAETVHDISMIDLSYFDKLVKDAVYAMKKVAPNKLIEEVEEFCEGFPEGYPFR